MILLRKAARIATISGTCIALAYLGINQTTGHIASILVIIGTVAISHAWETAWPSPDPSFDRIDYLKWRSSLNKRLASWLPD
jgi:hypothetical protein